MILLILKKNKFIAKMKRVLIIMTVIFLSSPVSAGESRYEIETDQHRNFGGSTDIEMRKKFDHDPSNKYRGEIDNDGSVRMKNHNGDRLRGTIDNDGYGRLRDQDGDIYRVKPR